MLAVAATGAAVAVEATDCGGSGVRSRKVAFSWPFAAARGGAHDIAVHGGFGCFGGGF